LVRGRQRLRRGLGPGRHQAHHSCIIDMGGVLLVRLRWPGELAIHKAPRRPHALSEIIVSSVWILEAETAVGNLGYLFGSSSY
jgi:hypothetical protein